MTDHTLEALVPRVCSGDADALGCLLCHYQPILRGALAKRLRPLLDGAIELDDVLQQAFISAFEALPDARPVSLAEFYAWLERIAENDFYDLLRARRRKKRDVRRQVSADAHASVANFVRQLAGQDPTPSRPIKQEEAVAATQAALARLTPDQRRVIEARYFESASVAELAEEMGKSEQAIHALCTRALKALREHLGTLTRFMSRL